ncbi:hypothetical protein Taro_032760 [Colocasia esculenta]|uniref:Uncharacterized protein n=1 Tax=Colocasia esculenta TaxID=4460 RepID=A0A843WAE0_COLES|nr:hypothetical protein [Colocasia esculenta]
METRRGGALRQYAHVHGCAWAVAAARSDATLRRGATIRRVKESIAMATRGCRGVGPSRGDESAEGSQAPAQQAQDQTGVPLPPPPPPVDYGALMQGLVHAMQTQAQTTTALQAQV